MKRPNLRIKQYIDRVGPASCLFIGLAILFGLCFTFATPPFWGQDEETHFARAYQLAGGHLHSVSLGSYGYGGKVPTPVLGLIRVRTDDVLDDWSAKSHKVSDDRVVQYKLLGNQSINSTQEDFVFTNTAVYSPASYAPYILPILISKGLNLSVTSTLISTRISGLIGYIVLVCLALWALRKSSLRWVIFTVALLPTSLYQASVVSSDGIVIGVSILLAALVAKGCLMKQKLSRLETYLLLMSAIVLPILKISYFLMSLLIALVPSKNLCLSKKSVQHGWLVQAATLGIAVAVIAIWNYYVRDAASMLYVVAKAPEGSISAGRQLAFVIGHPLKTAIVFARTAFTQDLDYILYSIGQFSAAMVTAPGLAIVGSIAAMFLSALGATQASLRKITKKKAIIYLGIIIGSLGLVFGTLYLTFSEVGSSIIGGIQGRYFIPLLPLALLLLAYIISSWGIKISYPKRFNMMIVGLVVFSLVLSAIKFMYALY